MTIDSKPQRAPASTPAPTTAREAELLLALRLVKEDVRHAMGKAITAFVKHGYAARHGFEQGEAQAVFDFDQAMEEIRVATVSDKAAAANTVALSLPKSNDGKEQDAFEAWAAGQKYDMTTHPMHWLFLNERTYAARQGWKAALEYVSAEISARPAAEKAGGLTTTPMCERKTNDIMQRDGYQKTGYVLRKDDPAARICVSDGGAVAWFTLDQWNWLMFNRDHVEFAWPKPIGAIDRAPAADRAALKDGDA